MGFNTLIFLKDYNNYFNRIVKKYDKLQDYIDNYEYSTKTNINFVPRDGINTNQIINWNESWMPDYVLIVSENEIVSRWFIIESDRELTGQYNMFLKRDVIADYYNQLIEAPCFVEKATLTDNDTYIYNSEGGVYNQIKMKEYLLKDYTNSAWLVGYTARDQVYAPESGTPNIIEFEIDKEADFDWNSTNFPEPGETKTFKGVIGTSTLSVEYKINSFLNPKVKNNYLILTEDNKFEATQWEDNIPLFDASNFADLDLLTQKLNSNYNGIYTAIEQIYPEFTSETVFNEIWNYNGKTVVYLDENDKPFYYTIKIEKSIDETITTEPISLTSAIGRQIILPFENDENVSFDSDAFFLNYSTITYEMSLEPYKNGKISVPFSETKRELSDAPYDMFCIPYGDLPVYENSNTFLFDNTKEMALNIAQGIVQKLTNSIVYDLQLLPYCPVSLLMTDNNGINLNPLTVNKDYDIITITEDETQIPISVIFWAQASNGTFNIPFKYSVKNYKIENECDLWRLCSPNFNGMFDFSAAKNKGIDYFNVDWTYKPYTPYIHINPNFDGLYGRDFNDSRGLICGGDYSVATAVSKFAEFEIQNKNYQNVFDRNIQNLDKMHNISQWQNSINGVIDTGNAAFSGYTNDGVAGAAIQGGTQLAKQANNRIADARRHKENKSYMTDQFNFQLGNVQALPMSLTKSSALTYNNKIWPILEYYTASWEERYALEQKLKYNGMTVMRIGRIKDYLKFVEPQFFQGQMIRLENLADDSHIAYAIYDEIKKGVYI